MNRLESNISSINSHTISTKVYKLSEPPFSVTDIKYSEIVFPGFRFFSFNGLWNFISTRFIVGLSGCSVPRGRWFLQN